MGTVINRYTFEKRELVQIVDYQDAEGNMLPEWLDNPRCDHLKDVPLKYWKNVGEQLIEMDEGEKLVKEQAIEAELAYEPKPAMQVLKEIEGGCTSQTQAMRLYGCLDVTATFYVALEDSNYNRARFIMLKRLSEGMITQTDFDLINAVLPLQK